MSGHMKINMKEGKRFVLVTIIIKKEKINGK